jgi:hypothetical protein
MRAGGNGLEALCHLLGNRTWGSADRGIVDECVESGEMGLQVV